MIVLRRGPLSGIDESRLQHSDYFIVRTVRKLSVLQDWDMVRVLRSSFQSASATRLAMDPFDKKPILPIEIMITVAINIVVATLGYYAMIFWGIIRG
jgi:hypothetical protein